jgi:hypothetical protein
MAFKADDLFYISGIEKKASKVVYHRFRVNRHELNMLASLAAYLQLHGKQIIGRKVFTDWLGLNYGLEKRCWAYLSGLIDKGCLHRLAFRRPDGNSLAISEYGIKVLDAFYQAIALQARIDKPRRPGVGFRDLPINLNALPDGYTLKQAGRAQ